MEVKIKRVGEAVVPLPTLATEGSVCYDVAVASINYLDDNLVEVGLGFSTEIPKGYKGVIVPRSSLTHKGWIMANSPGQVDSDYRGEWKIKFQALPTETDKPLYPLSETPLLYPEFPYKEKERVAQIYFEKVVPVDFVVSLEDLKITERGAGGFGSTGKK